MLNLQKVTNAIRTAGEAIAKRTEVAGDIASLLKQVKAVVQKSSKRVAQIELELLFRIDVLNGLRSALEDLSKEIQAIVESQLNAPGREDVDGQLASEPPAEAVQMGFDSYSQDVVFFSQFDEYGGNGTTGLSQESQERLQRALQRYADTSARACRMLSTGQEIQEEPEQQQGTREYPNPAVQKICMSDAQNAADGVRTEIGNVISATADAVQKAVQDIMTQLYNDSEERRQVKQVDNRIIAADAILINPATYYQATLIKAVQLIHDQGCFSKVGVHQSDLLIRQMWTVYGEIRQLFGAETDINLATTQQLLDEYLQFIRDTRKGYANINGTLVQSVMGDRAVEHQTAAQSTDSIVSDAHDGKI